jgi:hypothetical protein
MMDQAWKIRKRLGTRSNLFERLGPWDKPQGMHWRTFYRLMAKEQRYQRAMLGVFHTLLAQDAARWLRTRR